MRRLAFAVLLLPAVALSQIDRTGNVIDPSDEPLGAGFWVFLIICGILLYTGNDWVLAYGYWAIMAIACIAGVIKYVFY